MPADDIPAHPGRGCADGESGSGPPAPGISPAADHARQRQVARAVHSSASALLAVQRDDATWHNPRPGSASGTAAAVLALHTADPGRSAPLIVDGVGWLLRHRNADGGWGTLAGCPSDFLATTMAVTALRTVAAESTAAESRAGLRLLDAWGGPSGLSDPTMAQLSGLLLSTAGLYDAGSLRRVPGELLLLPGPARQRLLSYVQPPFAALTLFQLRQRRGRMAEGAMAARLRSAAAGVLERFTRDEGGVGSWGGDPWLTGLVCTALRRAGTAPHLVRDAVDYLRATAQPDGGWQLIHGMAVRQVEVTGPAFAAEGLAHAGYRHHPRLARAAEWLVGCRQRLSFPLYGCPPGGWAWSGPVGWPNTLDSLAVLVFLAARGGHRAELAAGATWLRQRQDRRGSWSSFVRDTRVPLDGPCAYITAKAVEVLHASGALATDPAIRRALRWLTRRQRPNGSFPAVWHRGGVPATAAVLRTLNQLGLGRSATARRAREWLCAAQLPDGSWGSGPGAEAGTTDETARAVDALLAARPGAPAAGRGVDWLLHAQRADGSWPAGQVCVYIRGHVRYTDHLMAQGLALRALTSYQRTRTAAGSGGPR